MIKQVLSTYRVPNMALSTRSTSLNGDPALKEVPSGGEGDRGTCAAARKGASALPAWSEWGSPLHVPGSLSQNDQEGILEEGTLELQPHEKDT